jgi:hypothetical protein
LAIEPEEINIDRPKCTQHIPHQKLARRRSVLPRPSHLAIFQEIRPRFVMFPRGKSCQAELGNSEF